jgi:hypothetical protein
MVRLFSEFVESDMANPNPSPATRFKTDGSGNPSRAKQKGARDRLSAELLTAFADDFAINGKGVIEKVRTEDPSNYLRIAAALLPKQLEVENVTPESVLSEEQMDEMIALMKAELGRRQTAAQESDAARLGPVH